MIGPTGVGKTEIARRLARLANAPFIKIEATKFTEVGYVGRDVDTIIRDLAEIADQERARAGHEAQVRTRAEDAAEDRILDALLPPAQGRLLATTRSRRGSAPGRNSARSCARANSTTRKSRSRSPAPSMQAEIFAPPGMEELTQQIQGMFQNMGGAAQEIAQAEDQRGAEAAGRRGGRASWSTTRKSSSRRAQRRAERHRLPRRDRQDRLAQRHARRRRVAPGRAARPAAAGRRHHGVDQVRHDPTDHILFIASGAFHLAKPSDLIPELQGRFPIRVELDSLSVEDFERILTRPTPA
jgi:ATP-dependent HslUV protease ATP-binding subunit HslU